MGESKPQQLTKSLKNKINEIIDGKCEVVVGSYVGKCELKEGETTSQIINLGFRPSAVEVYTSQGEQMVEYMWSTLEKHLYGGLALDGAPLFGYNSKLAVEIIDDGFICHNYMYGKNHYDCISTCKKGTTYYYKAYKNCTRKDFS